MSRDASWTNPGFQPDEIEFERSYNGSYAIPRVDSNNRENETWFPGIEPKDGIPRAHYKRNGHRISAIPATRLESGKEATRVSIDEQSVHFNNDQEEEDYSLMSFFSCFKRKGGDSHTEEEKLQKKSRIKLIINRLLKSFFALLYLAYFVTVLIKFSEIEKNDKGEFDYGENYWCKADGFLIIITSVVLTGVFYFKIFKPYAGIVIYKAIKKSCKESPFIRKLTKFSDKWYVSLSIYVLIIAAFLIFLIIDTKDDRERLISALGIFVLLLFGFLFSVAPRKVVWRHVMWGMVLQFIMGLIILRWSVGRAAFKCLGDKVHTFLQFTDKGSEFIFGQLVSELSIFAFKVLSVILFFSFCIQILYYFGAMQWIVIKLGWVLQVTVGTTACESVNAAANIFLGQTEAPLLIKPYLPDMTRSELHAVMTGGFATIAGAVLAAYISFGVDPSHLLSASVMSAPAALAFSKLFYPETEVSKTKPGNIKVVQGDEANVLHAAIEGVTTAIPLVANIAANLLAFIAFIAFVDAIFNWTCLLVNVEDGVCTLSNIMGYILMPLAWIMGVPWADCYAVGQLIGTKTIVNEFVGYLKLAEYMKNKKISKRAEIIATYALCGFSNISGIGIQVGGLGALAPERKRDLSIIAVRAVIAGSVACFLTACVAGTLLTVDEDIPTDFNSTSTYSVI